jgi:hypothetical protein
MPRRRGRDAFIIFTKSDPIAKDLSDYLEEQGFITPSGDIWNAAMVLVTFTNKRDLNRSVRKFFEGADKETLKSIKIRKVDAEHRGRGLE